MPPNVKIRFEIVIMVLGLAAAVLLLDPGVPVWLRILPWVLVFGYPVWRMGRTRRR